MNPIQNIYKAVLEGDLGTTVEYVQASLDSGKEALEILQNGLIAGVDIIGLSALLTTTMPSMEQTISALKDAGLRDQVKVIVGGAPVTAEYAHQIGADGFAPDASQAVTVTKALLI